MYEFNSVVDHECGPECDCGAHHHHEEPKDNSQLAETSDYVAFGTKWGDSNSFGTSGQVVTWSLAGSVFDKYLGVQSVALGSFLSFDYEAALKEAFDAWSAVSGIKFVQVNDDGTTFNNVAVDANNYIIDSLTAKGGAGDIRINAGYIDGSSGTLAYAFGPGSGNNASEYEFRGNITFDSGEATFWNYQSFVTVAMHEIGHSIGLNHTSVANSLMNPTYNPSVPTVQSDDISGAQGIYGNAANQSAEIFMKSNTPLVLQENFDQLVVTGTSGDDVFAGSGGSQIVVLAGGNDTAYGLDGNDTIYGESGNDTISGGAGNDIIVGGEGNDLIFGDDNVDLIFGGADDDTIYGGDHDDTIYGNTGNDIIVGGSGNDILVGAEDNDTIYGQDNADTVYGESGADVISGGGGSDVIVGGVGDDLIFGDDGDDLIFGSDGDDQIYGGANDDTINGGNNNDTISGDSGNDTLAGGIGNDNLDGGAGNDYLFGDVGNDILNGGIGDDRLEGGLGTDTLTGSDDNDTFIFRINSGIDTITDFIAGSSSEDVIELNTLIGFTSYADVLAAATDDGIHTTIALTAGDKIIINNVLVVELHQDDFTFIV